MAARLILNADDFGLTPGINRAIAELHTAGVLTSATLMANGAAFDDAVDVAKSHPTLGVGCHVVLVDGVPVSPPREIPTLLGPDKKSFRPSLGHFVRDLLLGRIDEDEIAREALAQVQKLQRGGIDVTHIDTHKHTHMFPAIAEPILRVVRTCGVRAIRYPFEPRWSATLSREDAGPVRRLQLALLRRYEAPFRSLLPLDSAEVTTSGTLGMAATGSLGQANLRAILSAILTDHDEGILYELCCHPGYQDGALDRLPTRLRASREIERQALLTVIPKILSLPNSPELIHYGNLEKRP